ncbi:cell division protein FtsZ [bacterium]|nr:cell division protein FtsZ [bacterium]
MEYEANADLVTNQAAYPQAEGALLKGVGYVEDLEQFNEAAAIKVIGVGGGGCNAVDSMVEDGIIGVEFIAVNTDEQSLSKCSADKRIQIGKEATRGLGAGANPEMGRKSIEESKEEVLEAIGNADMVFVTAGMGGGTGTGAAPVVASLAKQSGALTVAIVTKPFTFEGRNRMKVAEAGIEELRKNVDAIIVVPNDRILEVIDDEPRADAFNLANDVLRSGVRGISEIITACGEQNVDFADVRTIMSNKGSALLGIGSDSSENRAENAARSAISSPLWEGNIHGATGVLFNVVAASNFTMKELQDAANVIYEAVDPDANIIFGSVTDESMEREVRITVVATGFPETAEIDQDSAEGFPFGSSEEQVPFAPQPVNLRGSDEYEPAVMRRRPSSMGRMDM